MLRTLFGKKQVGVQSRIAKWLLKKQLVNRHLNSYVKWNEMQNFFLQYIPDRYSAKLADYQHAIGFLEYNDVAAWTKGNYRNNIGDLTRFFALNLCIDQLIDEKLTGHIAELGVYKGNSAVLLARFARRLNSTCYLFDTFEGFDERDLTTSQVGQDFSDTSLVEVKKTVGLENVTYVKGFFPDSLAQVDELQDLVLVHIDCDLEAPFRASLTYFYPRLKKGGFLIMHDYLSMYWPGAKLAIDDFFKDKPEFVVPIPDKSGTCIIRKL